MNSRIKKISAEIAKTKEKIAEQTAKLKELEGRKTELENAEYVAACRSVNMSPEQLAAFIRKHTHGGTSIIRAANPADTPDRQEDRDGNK
ncbi:transposase [Actinomycetota bacterium]|nr:transposase [Actinomycetota bacterium]